MSIDRFHRPVSVIIPVWGQPNLTVDCLNHLQACLDSRTPVILIDNASGGEVQDLKEVFKSRLNIEVILNKTNLGFSRAVNQGIRIADPSHDIVLMNNDVRIQDASWVEKLAGAACSDETIGIAGCRLIRDDGTFLHGGLHVPPETFWAVELGGGETDIGQYSLNRTQTAVTFAVVYLKRALIDAIGLLDEDYFAYFEDIDYCLRAREAGFRAVFVGDLTCLHLQGGSTRDNRRFFTRVYRKSQGIFMQKWGEHSIFAQDHGVVWHSVANFASGYSLSSREIMAALERNRIDVRYKYVYGKGTVSPVEERPSHDPIGLAIQSKPLEPYPLQVTYSQADLFYKNFGRYRVGFTMFEADGLPAGWVEQCNRMDEVWVPSTFNAQTFTDSGVKVPIHVMPLGVDVQHFNTGIRPRRFSSKFTFFSSFEWSERKGQEILIRAFLDEFKGDEALLVLKVFNPNIFSDIPMQLSQLHVRIDDLHRVLRIDSDISYDLLGSYDRERLVILVNAEVPYYQLGCLYRGVDCFVLPTKGEGWGMPIMEAMACGTPVIATAWGGHMDFFDSEKGFPIRVERMIPCVTQSPYYKGLHWALPDYEHLRSLMRRVFEHRDEARQVAGRASDFILQHFRWDRAIQPMANRIREIYSDQRLIGAAAPSFLTADR